MARELHRPRLPGALLREHVLPSLEMTQEEFAAKLGVSRMAASSRSSASRSDRTNLAAEIEVTDRA